MAATARAIHCRLPSPKPALQRREQAPAPAPQTPQVLKVRPADSGSDENNSSGVKIMLQPRLCTLRSYGSDRVRVMRTRRGGGGGGGEEVSPFFEKLYEYIESSNKSHDFEIISGRLAMIVFAATVTMEVVTGNSLFRKMDLQGIAEAIGVCVGAVACAAIFAWFSSARNRVGQIFTLRCNTFIDSLIDQIVDGLFYEGELSDRSDDI